MHCDYNFTEVTFHETYLQKVIASLGYGLVSNRWQAVLYNNDGLV